MDLVAVTGTETLSKKSSQLASWVCWSLRVITVGEGVPWERMEGHKEGTTGRGPLRLSEAGAGARQVVHM